MTELQQTVNLDYQGNNLPVVTSEGHKMIPVRTVCEIIGVQYKVQDSWLKNHPFYAQLYRLDGVVAADGKVRQMNCLPIFDTLSWLSSITSNKRKEGSADVQYQFMTWLRGKMLEFYHSVDALMVAHREEVSLLKQLNEAQGKLLEYKDLVADQKKEVTKIQNSIAIIQDSKLKTQLRLDFPKAGSN